MVRTQIINKAMLSALIGMVFLLCGCEETASSGDNYSFIGEWKVAQGDAYISFTFTADSIYRDNNVSETLKYNYKVVNDSIEVIRCWEIEKERIKTKHQYSFISKDSLFIEQFLAIDYGVTGFLDIMLHKK